MTGDRYTKVVLTVIAVCLVWISLGGPSLMTPVDAQAGDSRVTLAGWVDADGRVRPFPNPRGTAAVQSGKPMPPAALPTWDTVANPNP